MNRCPFIILTGLTACLIWGTMEPAFAQAQDRETILNTLRKEHPRLIALEDDIKRVKTFIQNDETAKTIYERVKKEAVRILTQPTVEYKIVGPRLLSQSRRCLSRLYTLAAMYRLDGDEKYRRRAVKELSAAAAFPDWNPSHFLDTAEMTHAFAIGYDWLYNDLSADEKTMIREAIIEKGLKAALPAYEGKLWWARVTHNWNQVCNGGIGIGALAVADEAPKLASTILNGALQSIPKAIHEYAPDGGWNEGPGYWHYATRYTVYFMAALQSALGTDFGLSDRKGFDRAGIFRVHFTGPIDETFNYADAGSRAGAAHEMFWLARRFNLPVLAWHQRQRLQRAGALDLLWYTPEGADPGSSGIPLDAWYKGIDVVFLRSAWNDPNAIFIGFKGGDNKANHSHLDLGSFVLDAEGTRWAVDLGSDNYNLPGYFGNKRWTYYRLRTESHNTLVINGENQDPKAEAPITQFTSKPERSSAVTDLSKAYAKSAQRVQRGIALTGRQHVLIQDEIEADAPVDIEWGMLTPAQIDLQGKTAILKKNGKRLRMEILQPQDAQFEILSANPPKPQRQQPDIHKLAIGLKQSKKVTISILITPGKADTEFPFCKVSRIPLGEW